MRIIQQYLMQVIQFLYKNNPTHHFLRLASKNLPIRIQSKDVMWIAEEMDEYWLNLMFLQNPHPHQFVVFK